MIDKTHHIRIYSPGTLFPNTDTYPVSSWGLQEAVDIVLTTTAFKFVFYTTQAGVLIKESNGYFINGVVESAEEVLTRTNENERILRSNVLNNEMKAIITTKTSYKNTTEFTELDTNLIIFNGKIIKEEKLYIK